MRGELLDIEPGRTSFAEMRDEMKYAKFGDVGHAMKHALTCEHAGCTHAIQASNQGSAVPRFDAVSVPHAMHGNVGADHCGSDPSTALPGTSSSGASPNHRLERAIDG